MASQIDEKREIERLEDENKVLMERLTGLENELCRRDKSLQELTEAKERAYADLKESQREVHNLQDKLEELEDSEIRAKGLADKLKAQFEEERIKFKRDHDHLQSSLRDFQIHLKDSEENCQQAEEKYHMILSELEEKVDFVSQLEKERNQVISDSSSRLANLNQILLSTKQTCGQLETRNEELEGHEIILTRENETLEKRCMELSEKLKDPCQYCKKLVSRQVSTTKPLQDEEEIHRSVSTPTTPFRPLPEHTEIDRLLEENGQLKQKYDCLFANYQMVSEKSTQLKKEFKDMERSLNEIQGICDRLRYEKEELMTAYEKTKEDLETQQHVLMETTSSIKRHNHMMEQSRNLMDELNEIQCRHDDLLIKNGDLQSQLQSAQDNVGHLRNQISSLKLEKTDNEKSLDDAKLRLVDLVEELHRYRDSYNEGCGPKLVLSKESSDSIEACKTALDSLMKEREGLKERIDKLERKASGLEEEKISLSSTNEELRKSLSHLENEKRTQERQIQDSMSRDHEELEDLRTKLDTLVDENCHFQEENASLKTKLNEYQIRMKDLKTSVTKYRSQYQMETEKVLSLQNDLDSLKSVNFIAEEDSIRKEEELELAKNLLKRFKQDLRDSAEAHGELENETMQCRMRIDELETLNFELESSLAEKKSREATLVTKRGRMEERLEELKSKLIAMEEVLYEKETQLNEKTISCDLLVKENSSLLTQLDQLSQALMDASSKEDSLKEQLQRYDIEMREIASQIGELEAVHLNCQPIRDELEGQLERCKERIGVLEEEISSGRVELSSVRHEGKQQVKTRRCLEEKVNELESQLQKIGLKNEDLSAVLDRKENQLLELTEHGKTKSEQLRSAEKENGRLRNEIQENRRSCAEKLEKAESKYYQLQEAHDQLVADKSNMSSKILQLSMEVQELEQMKGSTCKEREELEKKIDVLKDGKATLQKELESLQTKWKEAKRELKHIKKKYEREISYEQQFSQAVNQFKSLRDEALSVIAKPTASPSSNNLPSSGPAHSLNEHERCSGKLEAISEEDLLHSTPLQDVSS